MRRVQVIVALMATGAFLFAGMGRSGATVICKGIDGHVNVETAIQGVCTSDVEGRSGERTGDVAVGVVQHLGDHCGPCVDTPLATGPGEESSVPAQTARPVVTAPVVGVLPETSAPAVAHIPSFARATEGLSTRSVLVGLRTVTLLV